MTEINPNHPQKPRLNAFVGYWTNTGKVYPGPFGPAGPVTGASSYHWDMNGKWLLFTSQLALPEIEAYEVRGGVAFNSQTQKYDSFAFNSLGILLAYEGAWMDDKRFVFTSTYPRQGTARVIYTFGEDGSFIMVSESKTDAGEYKTYFEMKFKKEI